MALVERKIATGIWHHLRVEVHGTRVEGFVNGDPVIFLDTGKPLGGYLGLWSKSDSTTWFDELIIEKDGARKKVAL